MHMHLIIKISHLFLSGVFLVMERVTKTASRVTVTETLCISYSSQLHGKCTITIVFYVFFIESVS